MEEQSILAQQHSLGIGIITLNRPERHNAFTDLTIKQLKDQLLAFDEHPEIKIILLNANGKNFCAGGDIEWMKRMVNYTRTENFTDAMNLAELLRTLASLSKPTIAVAKGLTMGGGVGLLACADIVIAHEDAVFGFPEVKLGLVPATIAPYIIQAVGIRQAQYYFLTAKSFNVAEAKTMGLVHEITAHRDSQIAGLELATSLLKNGPQAIMTVKRLVAPLKKISEEMIRETAQLIADIRVSDEAQEGLGAFLAKREPSWTKDIC